MMERSSFRQSPVLVGVCVFIVALVLLGWAFGPGCKTHGHELACRHYGSNGRQDLEFLVSIIAGIAAWGWAKRG